MKNPNIDFVYFDVGGVLLNFRGALHTLAADTGIPHAELEQLLVKYDDDLCLNKITVSDMWKKYVEELKAKEPDGFDYLEYLTSHYLKVEAMHGVVYEAVNYYRIGLLTNTYDGMLERAIRKGYVPDVPYEIMVESCKIGMIKPSAEIFTYAKEKVGVPASKILLIDDMPRNVGSARDAGWQTYLFDEQNPEKSADEIRQLLFINQE